jgi:hypothetical protein
MRKPKPKVFAISDLIDKYFEAAHLKPRIYEARIRENWKEIVGEVVNKYTTEVYLNNQTLYLRLNSDVVKHELNYKKSLIIGNINTFINDPYIKEVVLL